MAFIRTKKHRLLDDNTYMLQSEWTSSRDVEMDNGNTLENTLGGWSFYDKELTQAEYDALDEELKNTPKLIFVIKKDGE